MNETEKLTGYPSIDKPWTKYYREGALDAPLSECSLYEYLYECNKDATQDYALNYFGKKITYGRLFQMIDKAAKAFWVLGVQPEEIVSIVSVSTVASVVCFYALNKIGAVVNFLNVLAEEKDLQAYFEEAQSRVIVTLDLFADKVFEAADKSRAKTVVVFSVDYEMPVATKVGYRIKAGRKTQSWSSNTKALLWKSFLKLAKGKPEIHYKKDPHKMCLLAHTGGTTGEPKAVMLDDCAMNAVVSGYFFQMGTVIRGEIFLNVMIPFVVYGSLCCMHIPLCLGYCLAVIPKFQPDKWSEYFRKYKVNHVDAVPAYVSPMLTDDSMKNIDLSVLKNIGVGGDGMTNALEEEVDALLTKLGSKAKLLKGYGMTEVCAGAIICFEQCNRFGSVGIPLPKNNMMIYDNAKKSELTYGEIGEVCIQSPSRMIGYMNNAEATKELFRIHEDGSEWLHTGDLGYIDEDGFLFLVGRMKRVILTTEDGVAYKVFPNMSEKILNECNAVIQSCIVGVTSGNDQVLKAYIMVSEENLLKSAEIEKQLRILCEEQLSSYARPTFYEFRGSLPLTAAGKVDYRELERQAEE